MMSERGTKPHQNRTTMSDQDPAPNTNIDSSTVQQQQSKQNSSKRSKEDEASFEREHRLVNTPNQYFYNSSFLQGSTAISSRSTTNGTNTGTSRSSYPLFRRTFVDDKSPSELSVIKDINKHCCISLSYGRYSSMGQKKSFLLYGNSNDQFDCLIDKNKWPIQIFFSRFFDRFSI